jgi:hypothetical protein
LKNNDKNRIAIWIYGALISRYLDLFGGSRPQARAFGRRAELGGLDPPLMSACQQL